MKALSIAICLMLVSLASASGAEIKEFTNDQLLAEIEHRLYQLPSDSPISQVYLSCDSQGTFSIENMLPDGVVKEEIVYLGFDCPNQLKFFPILEMRLYRPKLFAICSDKKLIKYSARPEGSITKIASDYESKAACMDRARRVNSLN